MRRLVDRIRQFWAPRPDRLEIQRQMRRDDPTFRHIQRVQSEFIDAMTAKGILDGTAIQRERRFWERTQEQHD